MVACQLAHSTSRVISSHALIDNEATGFAFIDEDFARRQKFPFFRLKTLRTLEVIDGRSASLGAVTHIARAKLQIRNHVEDAFFFVTNSAATQ